jgi:hypothetical protein
MPYQTTDRRSKRKPRKTIDIIQNEFSKAYISTIDNSRRPQNSLSDMLNMELVQDNVLRPRPPLVRYGTQPTSTVVGRGEYRYNGQRVILWMLNIAGVGKIYKQVDGGSITVVDDGGTYDVTVWTKFCQSKGKVYPFNGVNKLSYIDLALNDIITYTALTTPVAPSASASANLTSGTKPYNQYLRVSANNAVGESIASATTSVNVNTVREGWSSETAIAKTVTWSWTAVTNATSYTLYTGDSAANCKELVTVTSLSYTDDGSLATNPFKLAPEGNSTDGFVPVWLYNDPKNAQIFGVAADNKLYYSAAGTGDFSPYNGGGWVAIDEAGDTLLNYVDGFRNGKGDPVITTSSRGAAGKGMLNHVTFENLTIGDQIIIYPNVYPAGGQSGTYAPRATFKIRDSLIYPTGQDIKSTGTSQNIVNIITTNTVSQVIEPDLEKINLQALEDAVGLEYKDRGYFALPVSSMTNNELWYIDFSRKNAWVLRWPIAITDMWLYEDNDGYNHFCVLVDNVVLEFTRAGSQTHQDDGDPWRSNVGFSALNWDKSGITLGQVRNQYFKLLQPKGIITANATGITRRGVSTAVGSDTFTVTTTYTGYDIYAYDEHVYDEDPGQINSYGKSVSVLKIRPKGLLNQESWNVGAETAGSDYILSTVTTRGWYSEELVMKTI